MNILYSLAKCSDLLKIIVMKKKMIEKEVRILKLKKNASNLTLNNTMIYVYIYTIVKKI